MVKLVSVSASRPSALVWRNSVGTPAACSGSHTDIGHRGLAEADRHDLVLDHLVGAVGAAGRVGAGLAGHDLDRPAADAGLVGVPVLGRGLGDAELVGVVERLRGAVGHHADEDRLARRRVLGPEQVGGLVAGRGLVLLGGGIVVVIAAARDGPEQQHAQGGEGDRSPGPPAAAPWFFTRLLHVPSPEFWTICPGHLFPLLS